MNVKLVESLVNVIKSLDKEERDLLEKKLFLDAEEPTTKEIMELAQIGGSFDFLADEPDIYTLEDGEAI